MINRFFTILSMMLILAVLSGQAVKASDFNLNGLPANVPTDLIADAFGNLRYVVKRGQPYDEAKDPALRKGTENWEQEQGSYFAVPALVIGIIGAFMFFSRNKDD